MSSKSSQSAYPIRQYDIWLADLAISHGSHIIHGVRPVIVVSNNIANVHSPVITVIPLTTKKKIDLKTHVLLSTDTLKRPSLVLCEQIMAIDTFRLLRKLSRIPDDTIPYIKQAIAVQLNLAG